MNPSNNPEDYSHDELHEEIERGGRVIAYSYCVSIIFTTLRVNSRLHLIKAGHGHMTAGLPYVLISLVFGWWGMPWGLIHTPAAIFRTLTGGTDLTREVLNMGTSATTHLLNQRQ